MVKGSSETVTVTPLADECAHDKPNSEGYCVPKDELGKIAEIAIKANIIKEVGGSSTFEENTFKNLKKSIPEAADCGTHSCILDATKEEIEKVNFNDGKVVENIINEYFKPSGPWNSTEWLSDKNIEDSFKQFTKKYSEFEMMKFKMLDEFNRPYDDFDLIEKARSEGKTKIGFAANQDVSTGTGTHWVAIFLDFDPPSTNPPRKVRESLKCNLTKCNILEVGPGSYSQPFTIEFFNSAGGGIYGEVVAWATQIQCLLCSKGFVSDIILVSKVRHQEKNTECGVYTINYILKRLEGEPYTNFDSTVNKITDEKMEYYRTFLFRHSKKN